LGFSWPGYGSEPVPFCVICYEALTNDSMKPSNLKCHSDDNIKNIMTNQNKSSKIDARKLQGLKETMCCMMGGENVKAAVTASCSVLCLIVKSGAAEVIGDTQIQAATKVMMTVMTAGKASNADASVLHQIRLFIVESQLWPKA